MGGISQAPRDVCLLGLSRILSIATLALTYAKNGSHDDDLDHLDEVPSAQGRSPWCRRCTASEALRPFGARGHFPRYDGLTRLHLTMWFLLTNVRPRKPALVTVSVCLFHTLITDHRSAQSLGRKSGDQLVASLPRCRSISTAIMILAQTTIEQTVMFFSLEKCVQNFAL